jgi:molybdate-binding protein/DNA-binding transcriptional regulator YhcF (GntR family)
MVMVDEAHIYQKISDNIRKDILEGRLKPGDVLPSVRGMCKKWQCTSGTVQRAYHELTKQGLIVSEVGRGTRVSGALETPVQIQGALRKATLVNRAEAFLLEMLTTGHRLEEVERAFSLAVERWRIVEPFPAQQGGDTIRFWGSHDLAIKWISEHVEEVVPGKNFQINYTGSLRGLMALAEGRADVAGCHLWDKDTDSYNIPFLRRLLPGSKVIVATLATRCLGFILPPGNPQKITNIPDLTKPGVRFVNRQYGSGTRVWLDAQISLEGISPQEITGYKDERHTHSDVARAIADGSATVGLGLEAAAASYNLDFICLAREQYDLVFFDESVQTQRVQSLIDWLATPQAHLQIGRIRGYETENTGIVTRVSL